jgi:oxalate decarboxylase
MHPNRLINTFTLASSDVYFILALYPHYIEVLDKKIHFLIFFDQPMPKDVGFRLTGTL